jgi:hypothetical protein
MGFSWLREGYRSTMRRFGFFWHDSYDEPFYVEVETEGSLPAAFKKQWDEWIERLKSYSHCKDETFKTAEEQLAQEHTIREVGLPAIKWNPRPTCCTRINEESKYDLDRGPPVQLRTTRYNPETGDYYSLVDPHWVMSKTGDEVAFCPFCGTKLPEVEKMEDPPQPLWDGDDDYCRTCGERNMCCECNPPWTAYRIKK